MEMLGLFLQTIGITLMAIGAAILIAAMVAYGIYTLVDFEDD